MIPLTASSVVARLAIAESRETTNILTTLDDRERALARDLLARVGPEARIDVTRLVSDVRSRLRNGDLTLQERRDLFARADAHLARLRVEAEARGIKAGTGQLYALSLELDRRAVTGKSGDADDLDDEDDDTPRAQSVPRRRSHRTRAKPAQADDAVSATDAAPVARNRAIARPTPFRPLLRGGRFFAGGEEVGGDHCEPFNPPWLLPPDADAEAAA